MVTDFSPSATAIAADIRNGAITAVEVVERALRRAKRLNPTINCFTTVTEDRALAEAREIDTARRLGRTLGPLAGVPYAVKNLFDVKGLPTVAGSKIDQTRSPPNCDATLVARMQRNGAVLTGVLNMDEYAYGFTTENTHYGATRNPHDTSRMAGGSSGGSAAAVAAGIVPLALGSDTNGSIRVPASLCGIFGLKATFGRLSRAGTRLFSSSLDHTGPLAATVRDLAVAYDAQQGYDGRDPVCSNRGIEAVSVSLLQGISGLRIALADGDFEAVVSPEAYEIAQSVATALGVREKATFPALATARAAATIITAAEAGAFHLKDIRERLADFDPMTRDRFLAGSLVPSAWYLQAQRFRRWFQEQVASVFRTVDIILMPGTPYPAPPLGEVHRTINNVEIFTKRHLGIFTQPFSFAGLPVIAAPAARSLGSLPLGVQFVAAAWQEASLFRAVAAAEAAGAVRAHLAVNQ